MVTNNTTGKSVLVTVNDRGPFAHRRVIDLSQGAAKRIGCDLTGICPVSIAVLGSSAKKEDVSTRPDAGTVAKSSPVESHSKVYNVRRGDSLAKIAKNNNVTVADLARRNNVGSKTTLHPKQQLRLDC
mmetsp:Transcript_23327/g.38384  ORF Transcript_23327/g.38384 Transcript_23327/m.38384 type:complete len:128 (-) Transcript_23327:292-675(-)